MSGEPRTGSTKRCGSKARPSSKSRERKDDAVLVWPRGGYWEDRLLGLVDEEVGEARETGPPGTGG